MATPQSLVRPAPSRFLKLAADFCVFVQAGRALGDLHIANEAVEPYPVTLKQGGLSLTSIDDPVKFFRVEKMACSKGTGHALSAWSAFDLQERH